MAEETRELNELFSLIVEHIGTNFDSYRTEFIDGPKEPIRLFSFTSDVSVEVDGTALPAGRYAMWSPIDVGSEEDNVGLEEDINVSSFQLCVMCDASAENSEVEDPNGTFLTFLFGRDREDGPAQPIRFSDYLFEVLRSLSDEPEDRIRDVAEKFSLTRISSDKQTQGEASEETQEPPVLEAIKPNRHIEPNAKTTQVLTNPVLFEGIAQLDVGGSGRQMSIDFGLSTNEDIDSASITLTSNGKPVRTIEREDVAVIAAVVSLRKAGNNTVSPFQIAETMGYGKPTPELQEEIHGRVMKLRSIDGHIDWTAQAKAYHILNPETGKQFEHAELIDHLINCAVFNGTDSDGNRYIRYQINTDPLTYQHAQLIGQLVDYPQSLLDNLRPIDEDGRVAKRMTRDQTQIARQLLWLAFNKRVKTITYDKLFERAGLDTEGMESNGSKRRQRAVKFANGYLRAMQQEGVIDGFVVDTQGRGRKPVGVRVLVKKSSR